jgi:hypothetical protein
VSTLGIVLDDAALALAGGSAGAAPAVAPSIVDAGREQRAAAGQAAVATARIHPTAVSSRHWLDLAQGRPPSRESVAVARAELGVRAAALPAAAVDVACVAVPATFDGPALARLLAVCRAVPLPVAAFVDAAALAAAALGLRDGAAIVVELGLHHVAATRVDLQGGEARRRSARVRARGGLLALRESWLQLVSEAMVLKTRFDPLHEAATEQRLYDQLEAVAGRAARDGSAAIGLSIGPGEAAVRHEVVLTRDQFAARGEAPYRELVAMLHELRPAGMAVTLVAPARVGGLPGLRELLDAEFPGCELRLLPDGWLACAAAQLPLPGGEAVAAAGGAVPLRRGVECPEMPLDLPDAAVGVERLGGATEAARAERPTHLLWSGRALPLSGASIEIGRAPAGDGVVLPEGLAGVSRLHCTLRDDAGAIVLVDHSRHGTFVNGERVAGRARLRAGDRLRIGDPGVELALIAVGGPAGGPAGGSGEEAPQH